MWIMGPLDPSSQSNFVFDVLHMIYGDHPLAYVRLPSSKDVYFWLNFQ